MEDVPDDASEHVHRFLESLQSRGLAGYVPQAGEKPRFSRSAPQGLHAGP